MLIVILLVCFACFNGKFFFFLCRGCSFSDDEKEKQRTQDGEREKESQALHEKLHTLLVVNFFFEYFILEKNK